MKPKLAKSLVFSSLTVFASAFVTLNVLSYNDAKTRVSLLTQVKSDPLFPQNERGDVLSNAGLPPLTASNLRERLTFSYMLKQWYPAINSGKLAHNVPFMFNDFTDPAPGKAHMVVKSRICVEVGKVPEALYLNKVYDSASVPEQDVLNVQTHTGYPFPSTHKGLEGAQYYYSYPGSNTSAYLSLSTKKNGLNPYAVALAVGDEESFLESLCQDPYRNAAVFGNAEPEFLKSAVETKLALTSNADTPQFNGFAVNNVELSQVGIGIDFKVADRKEATEVYSALLKQYGATGLSVSAQAHAMLANSEVMLWDSFFTGFAIGPNKWLALNGGYDSLAEKYTLHLVLEMGQPE